MVTIIYFYAGTNFNGAFLKYDHYDLQKDILYTSFVIEEPEDIMCFYIYYQAPSDIVSECYVNVFCEYDFVLFDLNDPDNLFPKGEIRGAL